MPRRKWCILTPPQNARCRQVRGVNAHLPSSVAVQAAYEVSPEFSARFDAYGRAYRYVLCNEAVRPVILAGKVGWAFRELSIDAMQQAAVCLVGEHDFSSFRAAECQAKSPIKTMYSVNITNMAAWCVLIFTPMHFCITWCAIWLGLWCMWVMASSVWRIFKPYIACNRTLAPPTFMPDGLYLTGVDYPEHFGVPRAAIPSWLWGQTT